MSSGSLARLLDLADVLIDPVVGIIKHVGELPRVPGAPNFLHFAAETCDASVLSEHNAARFTGGASRRRDRALAKAIGEAIERYCGGSYSRGALPLSTATNAPFPHLAPGAFTLYSPEQYATPGFPFEPFSPETPVRWAPAVELPGGEPCWLPAAAIYYNYVPDQGAGEAAVMLPISTGLACHASRAEAAAGGLAEVIERDAFTITWQARMSRPRIDLATLPDSLGDLVERFHATGGQVTMLDLTMDLGVPTVLSVLRYPAADAPAMVVAAAAHPDKATAALKCLEELAHTHAWALRLHGERPPAPHVEGFANIKKLADHVHLYCDQANVKLADFLLASPRRIPWSEVVDLGTGTAEGDLAAMLAALARCGQRAFLADLTTEDIAPLGLHVVRVVVPGLHPLAAGHHRRALGGNRLWEVPQRMGYPGVQRQTGDNPAPHPFP